MNTLKINGIKRVGRNRLEYSYSVKGEWKQYFNLSCPMWVEYSRDVSDVPDSIAVLPLVGNFIVLAALMDAEIDVDEIDRDFYDCVEAVIHGYEQVMPDHVRFKRRDLIHAQRIVDNPLRGDERESNFVYFSGGVDAMSSMVSHIGEKPALVSVWGADVPWNQENTWNNVLEKNQAAAQLHGLPLLTIRTNLRAAYNDAAINTYSHELVREWWWPAFHHSVAMMCLSAPVARGRVEKLYFAASFTQERNKDWGNYVLASDPLIDNHVRFCGCQVVHDGNEFTRIEKCRRIGEYHQNKGLKPFIRVCYHLDSGENCGKCEKCIRTIMAIKLAGFDPREFGFSYSEEELPYRFASGMREMAALERFSFLSLYKEYHTAYRRMYTAEQVPPVLRLFYESEFEPLADFLCPLYPQSMISGEQEEMEDRQSTTELDRIREKNRKLSERIGEMERSVSWRMTKPVRAAGRIIKGIAGKRK